MEPGSGHTGSCLQVFALTFWIITEYRRWAITTSKMLRSGLPSTLLTRKRWNPRFLENGCKSRSGLSTIIPAPLLSMRCEIAGLDGAKIWSNDFPRRLHRLSQQVGLVDWTTEKPGVYVLRARLSEHGPLRLQKGPSSR